MFRNKWYDLLLKMRSEDRPSPLVLRDILYRKIKGSKKMEFGLNAYHRLPDKHPQKSHEFLLALIARHEGEVGQNDDEVGRQRRSSGCRKAGGPERQRQEGQIQGT